MDIVEEYLINLKRLEDGEKYFANLSDEEYEKIEETKEWNTWMKIFRNCLRLYPQAKLLGCNRITFY